MTWLLTHSSFSVNLFLHINRHMRSKPNFYVFHKELCHYFSSWKCMEKKNAVKLCKLVKELNLAESPSLSPFFFFLSFLILIFFYFCMDDLLRVICYLFCTTMYHANMCCTFKVKYSKVCF